MSCGFLSRLAHRVACWSKSLPHPSSFLTLCYPPCRCREAAAREAGTECRRQLDSLCRCIEVHLTWDLAPLMDLALDKLHCLRTACRMQLHRCRRRVGGPGGRACMLVCAHARV